MAKLTDDQISMIISLDAKGTQGEINKLEVAIHNLEKENKNLTGSISETEKEMAEMERQLQKLSKGGQQNTNAYKRLKQQYEETAQACNALRSDLSNNEKAIANNKKQIQEFTKGLNLNEMTMRQLKQRASELKRQLEITSKAANPEEYARLSKEYNKCAARVYNLEQKHKSCNVAMQAMFRAGRSFLKTNILGFAIAAATKAIELLIEKFKKWRDEVNLIKDIHKKAEQSYIEQAAKIRMLESVMKDNNQSIAARKDAIKQLQQIIPGYHASLSGEGTLIENDTTAINNYCTALNKKILLQAYEDKLLEKYKERVQAQIELDKRQKELEDARANKNVAPRIVISSGGLAPGVDTTTPYQAAVDNAVGGVYQAKKSLNKIDSEIKRINESMAKDVNDLNGTLLSLFTSGTEDAYQTALKKLQGFYKEQLKTITQQEADLQITKEKSQQKQLALQKEQAEAELRLAEQYGEKTTDLQLKIANIKIAINQQKYKQQQQELQKWLDNELREYQLSYEHGELSEENFEQNVRDLRSRHLDNLKALMEKYRLDTSDIEKQIADNEVKNEQDKNKRIIESATKARDEMLKLYSEQEKTALETLKKQKEEGTISTQEYEEKRKEVIVQYAQLRLKTEQTFATAVEGLNIEIVKKAGDAVKEAGRAVSDAMEQNIDRLKNNLTDLGDILHGVAKIMGDTLGGQVTSSLSTAIDSINAFMAESEHTSSDYVNMIGSVMTNLVSSVSAITKECFEMETASLEAEKQKQLTIAGDNAEKREQIEQEYAEKELELKKQQADANAALQSAQLWISTATGIANAWATAMMIPFPFGEIIASALTAALLATAGIQQAAIIKQRDAIKNTTLQSSGTSSTGTSQTASGTKVTASLRDEFKVGNNANTGTTNKRQYADGGYTGDGGVLQPAGIVHKGEYVVAQAEMRNPSVIPMVRAIESVRQKRIGGKQTQRSFANGGFTGAASDYVNDTLLDKISQLADQIEQIKKTPLRASVNYQEFAQADRIMTTIKSKASR